MKTTYTYVKLIVLFIFLSHSSQVNSQETCRETLERAETLFDQGFIEKIPELLEECINYGLGKQDRIRARRLIILAHLFDNNFTEAELAMTEFLKEVPEYQPQANDPAEFTALFSSFRTFPFLSIGAFIGANISNATMLEPYGPYNINESGNFSITTPQYQIGAGASIFLSNRWELNLESVYTRTNFAYSNLQYGFAQVENEETHQRLEFPVSFTFNFPGSQWTPFLRLGASYGLIISASGNYKRSYLNTGSTIHDPVEIQGVDISGQRSTNSLNAVIGSGLKYRIPRGFLVFDLRYNYGLSDLVNNENRWDQETVFTYYHTDSDFQLDYFTFSIGFQYSFFKSKKL
jgi:hypothetical protein